MLEKREEQEEQKIERLVRLMFEAELRDMENGAGTRKPVAFSGAFEQGMRRMIESQRQRYQIRAAVRYALAAAAAALLVVCLTNPGHIAKAWDVLVKWHSTHLEVDLPDAEWTGAVPEYELTYVPEGFELVMEDCDEFGGVILYENGERQIYMSYSVGGGNYNFDNEHSEISVIKDKAGIEILLVAFEGGGYSMLWKLKEELRFSLDADVDEKELFKIKDGIKVKK